jgi:hypothetical protein
VRFFSPVAVGRAVRCGSHQLTSPYPKFDLSHSLTLPHENSFQIRFERGPGVRARAIRHHR